VERDQLEGLDVMIMSALERRWLYLGFSAMNVIDVEYLDTSGRAKIGSGAHGTVEKGVYASPGRPGILRLSLQP
jgi:hypothetical protein